MEKEQTITILHVNDSPNDAEDNNKTLRNAGLALSPATANSAETLQQALKQKAYDIILIASPLEHLDVATALTIIKRQQSDACTLVIGVDDAEKRLAFMEQGAHDVFPEEPEGLLLAIVKREMTALANSRVENALHARLEDAEKRCNNLMSSSRDAIAYVHEGMHININESYAKMFGYEDEDDLAGMPIMDLVADDDQQKFKEFIRNYSKLKAEEANADNSTLSVHAIKADGEQFAIEMELTPAFFDGEHCTQLIIRDDSMNEALQAQLQEKLDALSTQDQRTSLYNRNYLLERLESTIQDAQENSHESGLLVLTIDNFDTLREQLGYQGSDKVIADLANIIKENAGSDAVAARVEAYTFGVLLAEQDQAATMAIADKLHKAIDNHIANADDRSVITTCSIGVNMIGSGSSSSTALLRAQKASEQASQAGGNRVELFVLDEKEMVASEQLAVWEQRIKKALASDQFFLVYQPVISLQGDDTHNYEVLIRLHGEDGEAIYPSDFLPVAEQTGQILELDRWVIAAACKRLSEQLAKEPNLRFNIKLSSKTISDELLIPWVEDHLKRNKLKGENLCFEVSVSQAAAHMMQTKTLFSELEKMGIPVSLEHFAGESDCFGVLKHLPGVSLVKLDTSLVRDIATNKEHMNKVQQVTSELSDIGKQTVAAGVEDPSGLSVIWQSGCHFIQGHFLQEPTTELDYDFSSFI